MPCYRPLKGYKSKELTKNGKRKIVFSPREAFVDMPVTVPCGQCIGCRLERSRQWAIRCVHEASLHKENCFVTLTYNDENLPENRSLCLVDFQKFFKRFRKKCGPGIRFFHCGEYGDRFARPHYHAIIFGYDFPDRKLWQVRQDHKYYTSEMLSSLWSGGFTTVGDVTFESAAYVARYITKKITGEKAKEHYKGRDPEYTTMSRRPGIGAGWFAKYGASVAKNDRIVINGKPVQPPKFYDGMMEIQYPSDFVRNKERRKLKAEKHSENNTERRLRVREQLQVLKADKLKRGYENEN